jgi:hypothetical protein
VHKCIPKFQGMYGIRYRWGFPLLAWSSCFLFFPRSPNDLQTASPKCALPFHATSLTQQD